MNISKGRTIDDPSIHQQQQPPHPHSRVDWKACKQAEMRFPKTRTKNNGQWIYRPVSVLWSFCWAKTQFRCDPKTAFCLRVEERTGIYCCIQILGDSPQWKDSIQLAPHLFTWNADISPLSFCSFIRRVYSCVYLEDIEDEERLLKDSFSWNGIKFLIPTQNDQKNKER